MAAGLGCALLFWVNGALAQEPVGAEPTREAIDEARTLYEEGRAHYAAGRYEDAVASFERAYALSGRSELLYNLASVYERLGDYERAADCLRRYLATPGVDDVVSLQERLRRLELTIARTASQPEPVSTTQTGVRSTSWPTVVLGGATAVSALTASTLGIRTLNTRAELQNSCRPGTGGTFCLQGSDALLDQERRRANATDVALGATAALGAATLAVAIRARRGGRRAVSVVPSVGPHGPQLVVVAHGVSP